MRKYSKSSKDLLCLKEDFIKNNSQLYDNVLKQYQAYAMQPFREFCKNCGEKLDLTGKSFENLGIKYVQCNKCSHINGIYEDTDEFVEHLYTESNGKAYAVDYNSESQKAYLKRVNTIYLPKADFLKESVGKDFDKYSVADFGAGAGYFVKALKLAGFSDVIGYEPSKTMVELGNALNNNKDLKLITLKDITDLARNVKADIVSLIGVLEHLQNPREVLKNLSLNKNVKYVFFSVPLFSFSVLVEHLFKNTFPRHISGGHTHLYTKKSIEYFCNEFNFQEKSSWWFGLDMVDMWRNALVTVVSGGGGSLMLDYINSQMLNMIDDLQHVFDKHEECSEVHMVLEKKVDKCE